MTALRNFLLCLMAAAFAAPCTPADAAAPSEQDVKAVFIYNFTHFVSWPESALSAGRDPFIIGVLGSQDFAALLESVVRDERVKDHPIEVQRFTGTEAIGQVHILFVERSESAKLEKAVALVKGRNTLTVSDLDDATQRGAMIQLRNVNKRIKLLINVDTARAAGLTINSNLLRGSDIVPGGKPN